jgi:transporter family protein
MIIRARPEHVDHLSIMESGTIIHRNIWGMKENLILISIEKQSTPNIEREPNQTDKIKRMLSNKPHPLSIANSPLCSTNSVSIPALFCYTTHIMHIPLWSLYALLAAASAALVGIFSKVGIKGVDATIGTAIRGLVIALVMGGAASLLGKWSTLPEISGRSLFFIILAGIFGGLSWLWGFLALQSGGDVTAVGAIDRLSIILILVFAVLFLGDKLTPERVIGVIFVAMGIILVTMTREQILELLPSFIRT